MLCAFVLQEMEEKFRRAEEARREREEKKRCEAARLEEERRKEAERKLEEDAATNLQTADDCSTTMRILKFKTVDFGYGTLSCAWDVRI